MKVIAHRAEQPHDSTAYEGSSMKSVHKLAAASLLGLLLSTSTALAFKSGDWVLGKYRNGPYWYPGVVHSADSDGSVAITYDDGDRERIATGGCRSR